MIETYQIVRDVNGFRVIFAEPTIDRSNFDQPQHASEQDAREWAEEILRLEIAGRKIAAE